MFKDVQLIATAKNLFRQFMKFGAVGVANTLVFYVLFLVLSALMKPTTGYYFAYVLSMMSAVFMHLKFTFEKRATLGKIGLFVFIYLFTMYLGGIVLAALIGFELSVPIAGLLTVGFIVIANFFGLKAAAKWA